MKLIYIANARFPTEKAHGLQIAKTIDALIKEGIDIELIVPKRSVGKAFKLYNPKKFYELDHKINVITLPCTDFLFLAPITPSVDFLLYVLQSVTFMFSATVYGMLQRKKVLYTRDPYLFFLLRLLRRNLFVELHTYPQTRVGKTIIKSILTAADGVVVTNDYLRRIIKAQGTQAEKILVASNGADLRLRSRMISKEKAKAKLGIPTRDWVVLYLGNFYRSKGIYVLAKAAANFPKGVKLLLVGGSRIDRNIAPLKDYISKRKLKNVEIVAYQERSSIPLYLSAADVCVLPNIITDKESEYFTTPLKMFDYMVAKRPIVASDLPALRQILDEKTAVFVRPKDPKELASGILHSLRNQEKSKKRVEAAFKLAKNFSWRKRAKKMKTFIKETSRDE